MQASLNDGVFISNFGVAPGTGLGVCGAGFGFLDFGSKNNNDGVLVDGVVEGFGGGADLEAYTGHVRTSHDLEVVLVQCGYVIGPDF